MDRQVWQGISASEIDAACRLLRVPLAKRQEVMVGVRLMAHAAAAVLNDRK